MPERVGGTESEYKGKVPVPNTMQPQPSELLSPSQKLRLGNLTGQSEDTEAPRDEAHWYGVDSSQIGEGK